MNKYFIEENINFYQELYNSLDKPDNQDNIEVCLISNQPLTENHITMSCGHKFNYQPLFYDILNHKKKFNSMERHYLRTTDIRCPYCRSVQKQLLPYIEGYPKIHAVNFIDDSTNKSHQPYKFSSAKLLNYGYIVGDCCYESSQVNELGEQTVKCNGNMVKKLINNKFYCPVHMSKMVKQMMLEKKLKLKEEKKKANEEEKMKKLEEKMKAKAEKKKLNVGSNLGENTVVTNETDGVCSQVLKTGIKKGMLCICKVFSDGLCKRHYTLSSKKIIEIIDLTVDEE